MGLTFSKIVSTIRRAFPVTLAFIFGILFMAPAVNSSQSIEKTAEPDYSECEMIMPRDRTEAFFKCPAPAANWPDKQAPANEPKEVRE